ncbi:PLP-dependent aminotransferase family protein [Paenarthrobacter ilicis]|uniref:DNA-binding transcriptional MocR family regulator n=1 Tax=Paenarthrobacter ilicis TaxID=43665 RepID=A0ABX0TGR4_9MICC|nr:PLP-dependent aminotransferase family protein [Paenarthrobacter ilicis]MBM7792091.1 DNA-binding transcriptional MocR family regulator [Paenarthrobacter ilicis]NIJ01284.1 DNA-binding transcriptional MocR family regulator [Paenarthrobacter ilicis]
MPASLNASALTRLLGPWNSGALPAYRELADVVRLLVMDGRIPLDVALPSERALAETLGLSRTTVTAAYANLREQGFLTSGQGSRGRTCIPSRSVPASMPGLAAPEGLLDLAYASLPAAGEMVHRAFADALTELPALLPGFGYDALGLRALREAIARKYAAEGVPTTPEQILVTSGAQHALNIVLKTLASRQDRVLVDHPTYPNALDAIRAAGCRPLAVALPAEGWDIDAMVGAMNQQRPAMAYLVPDFHNPTGRIMTDLQRRRLVRAAGSAGTVLVVDETLREVNLDGVRTLPLSAFGPAVVSIGSLSKSHWAGLRTGWIRAEESMITRFVATRTTMDLGGPVVEQLAAARLVDRYTEPLETRLAELRLNREALLELLPEHLPTWEVERPRGGLTVWCRIPSPCSTALTVLAPDFGVRLAAGPRFGVGGAFEHYVRVPYTLPPARLEDAVLALRDAQHRLDASPHLRRTLKPKEPAAVA